MGATTTTVSLDTLMKMIYSDPLIRDIVVESELMDMFKTDFNVQTEETTGGKYVEMAHYLRLAGAAGARAENDYIPVPQSPRAINSRIFLKKVMGVVEMSGDVMEKVAATRAFINFMERALPDTKERVVNEMDRMYIGFGAGIKARVKAGWVAGVGGHGAHGGPRVGRHRATRMPGSSSKRARRSCSRPRPPARSSRTRERRRRADRRPSTRTAARSRSTMDAALRPPSRTTTTSSPATRRVTASQNGGVDREIAGLLAAVDDGGILATYNNVARAGNRQFNARVIDASVAPYNGILTEDLLTCWTR
jgi:hypothetical protein